jgi:hypothetical protein
MYLPLGECSENIKVGRAGARVLFAFLGLALMAGVLLPHVSWASGEVMLVGAKSEIRRMTRMPPALFRR